MSGAAAGAAQATTDHVAALIVALVAGGVTDAVQSPGSRNTPVVVVLHALAAAGRLRLHTVLDERSAGFFALGLARVSGRPVLLSCTSGSAPAHYLPAFVEAAASGVSLLALTADRPPELHGRGAPQTVDQQAMFGAHARWFEDVPAPGDDDVDLVGVAGRALAAAWGADPGPVQLNLRLRAPLWAEGVTDSTPDAVSWEPELPVATAEGVAEWAAGAKRLLVVAGHRELACLRGAGDPVVAAVERQGWPVLAEPTSLLRFTADTVGSGDTVMRSAALRRALWPDRVLQIGRWPTGWGLQRFLEQHRAESPAASLAVDPTGTRHDPTGTATVLRADPAAALDALPPADRDWASRWRAVDRAGRAAIRRSSTEWWSGGIVANLLSALPEGSLLHVASSLPVRLLDAVGLAEHARHRPVVTSSRGANGIDGTLSTALGQAAGWDGPVAALVGDLAFLHDVGALVVAATSVRPVTVVVLDNGGGGIFDHLPLPLDGHEARWITPQGLDPVALARAAGHRGRRCDDLDGLRQALALALPRPGLDVLHCPVDRAGDLATWRRTWAEVEASALEALS